MSNTEPEKRPRASVKHVLQVFFDLFRLPGSKHIIKARDMGASEKLAKQ